MIALSLARPRVRSRRPPVAAVLAAAGLVAVSLGALLPWITVYAGLAAIPGYLLDGGALAGLSIAAAGLLVGASRLGGGRLLRPAAFLASLAVAGDAAWTAARIAAFAADPGPAGPLTRPASGPGALVMTAGGLLLAASAVAVRPLPRGLTRDDASRLLLAGALLLAAWIHLLLVPEHLDEAPVLGAGFLAAGVLQALLASAVILRPAPAAMTGAVAVSAALLALYAWSVALGLPVGTAGHGTHGIASGLRVLAGEPVDVAGGVNALAEVVALVTAFARLGGPRAVDRAAAAD